jgi:hypothetical protein
MVFDTIKFLLVYESIQAYLLAVVNKMEHMSHNWVERTIAIV